MTGLPVESEEAHPSGQPGSISELLSLKKAAKPKAADEKEKKLDEVDKKLQEMLFRGRKKKAKSEVEPAVEEPPAPPEPAPGTPGAPPPPKKPVKAPAKDRATELRERELALEKEKLDLEREKLELEKAARKPAEPQKEDADLSQLSQDERYELEVFGVMAKMDATKYGTLAKRFTDVAKATAKYKAEWEKENAGSTFNPDDSEHDSFFEKNQVRYDKRDFKRAEHRLATEDVADPRLEKLESTNKELLARDKLRELKPRIEKTWLTHAAAMLEAIDPQIAKSGQKGGKEQLLKDFPEECEEIFPAAAALEAVSEEAHKILESGGLFAPQAGNRTHEQILHIIRTQEEIIPRQPREDRLDPEGRDFATWAQWVTMSEQQQASHWHLGAEEVVDIVARVLAKKVKDELERIDKISEARRKRKAAAENGNGHLEEEDTIPPPPRSPSASPGAASKTTVDTPMRASVPADDKFAKIIRASLFKRSS